MDPSCFINGVATIQCAPSLIRAATNGFLIFSGMTSLFIIVWGSIRMITSGGDAKQIESARRMISFSIVGLIVVLLAFSLVNFVGFLTHSGNCISNSDLNTILKGCT